MANSIVRMDTDNKFVRPEEKPNFSMGKVKKNTPAILKLLEAQEEIGERE